MMPISDPRDRSFYPHHTPMKDTNNITFISVDLVPYEIFCADFAISCKVGMIAHIANAWFEDPIT